MVSIPFLQLILIGARIGGTIVTAPIFGSRNFPVQLKIALTFFLSLIVYPLIQTTVRIDPTTFLDFGFYLINELIIGLFIGLILTVFFNFIYLAGGIIDREIGFAMVNVVSPMDESEMPISSNLFYVFCILIFLQLNLHHQLITGIVVSFSEIPIGSGFLSVNGTSVLLDVFVMSFIVGFKIASPFVIIILIANIILGLLAKAMPGMNVFILGLPFKIFFGLLLFIVIMPYFYQAFANALKGSFYYIELFFELF